MTPGALQWLKSSLYKVGKELFVYLAHLRLMMCRNKINKYTLRYLFLILTVIGAASCCLSACAQKNNNAALDTSFIDVSYTVYASPQQKMDVWLVKNRTSHTPMVILLHGGGWLAGDKAGFKGFADFFISKGINVINLNYRLATASTSGPTYEDMMLDIDNALKYTQKNASKWNIRKNQYVLWGASAGAHLALLYGYKYDKANIVSAVCGIGTPTKLNDKSWNFPPFKKVGEMTFERLTGKKWTGDTSSTEMIKASPYYSKVFKPTFLIHGEKDEVVPPVQSLSMHDLLQQRGIESKYLILKGAQHSGEGVTPQIFQSTLDQCAEWVKKYSR
jgi:acetyl esterase/lipase